MTREFVLSELTRIPWAPALGAQETEQLVQYCLSLARFNQRINLVGSKKDEDVFLQIEDGLRGSYLLRPHLAAKPIYDLGSGNGIPGVILALLGPQDVLLVEKDQRKSEFLRFIAHDLGLKRVQILSQTIESLGRDQVEQAVCRGLASLTRTFDFVEKALAPQSRVFCFKGPAWIEEKAECLASHSAPLKIHLLEEYLVGMEKKQRVLLSLEKIG